MIDYQTFNSFSSPGVYLDLKAFDRNVEKVATIAKGKNVRVASKSIRSVNLIERVLSSHTCFRGILCYNPHECVFLAEKGFDDLLLAYPTTDREALMKIANLFHEEKFITIMIDSISHIELLHKIAKESSSKFRICLDIDLSLTYFGLHFGVKRSPLRYTHQVLTLIQEIKKYPTLILDGIMGYEAQIAGVADKMPGQFIKNRLITYLKRKSFQDYPRRRQEIVDALKSEGISLRFSNGGGTGSLLITREEEAVTEVAVGSALYAPHLFDYYRDFRYEPSLFFTSPIVRQPSNNVYTSYSGGYIASGATGKEKQPLIHLPKGCDLVSLEGAGEVQTPFNNNGDQPLEVGDVIVFRHSKAGELAERFTHIQLVENDRVIDSCTTYRGDGYCFH
ncbi:amino acid deaminase/aldolase [Bacillus sp. 2205SS5-2]|uniref:amino acid deaminase/aldolase n=1 Tax=Bacillus sp. 2205SS5-2 TaxID=3109031 RepID=UPI003007E582